MHVGQSGGITKRIDDTRLRPPHPAAVVGVMPIIDKSPTEPRRCQPVVRSHNCLGDRPRQTGGIRGVKTGTEAPHRCGSRMGVCRRDHHPLDRNARSRRCLHLGLVDQGLRHHAGVDDDKCQPHRFVALAPTVIQDHRPHQQRVVNAVGASLEKAAGDDRRGLWRSIAGGDIDGGRTGPKCRCRFHRCGPRQVTGGP